MMIISNLITVFFIAVFVFCSVILWQMLAEAWRSFTQLQARMQSYRASDLTCDEQVTDGVIRLNRIAQPSGFEPYGTKPGRADWIGKGQRISTICRSPKAGWSNLLVRLAGLHPMINAQALSKVRFNRIGKLAKKGIAKVGLNGPAITGPVFTGPAFTGPSGAAA